MTSYWNLAFRIFWNISGVPEKVNRFFVKDFLGDDKTEFIEILHTVTLGYYQLFA